MQEPFLYALRVLLFHNINMRADRGWPMYQCIHHSIISQGESVSGISDLSPTCFPAHSFHTYPRVLTDPNISCLYLKVFGAYTVPQQQLEKVIPPANLTDFRTEKQNSYRQRCTGNCVSSFWLHKSNTYVHRPCM